MTKANPQQICPTCGSVFTKPWKRAIYCSTVCQITPRLSYNPNGCVEWTGAKNNHGYGQIRIHNAIYYVHRILFEAAHQRKILDGAFLLHSCDNSNCVSPSHLREGSQSDNQQDALRRGRRKIGLTPEQTAVAIDLRGVVTQKELARKFGVTVATVHKWQKALSPAPLADQMTFRGSSVGTSKLNEDDVLFIRRFIKEHGRGSGAEMARKFSVAATTISRIRLNQCWRHVPD